jgi:hypothetical protein
MAKNPPQVAFTVAFTLTTDPPSLSVRKVEVDGHPELGGAIDLSKTPINGVYYGVDAGRILLTTQSCYIEIGGVGYKIC